MVGLEDKEIACWTVGAGDGVAAAVLSARLTGRTGALASGRAVMVIGARGGRGHARSGAPATHLAFLARSHVGGVSVHARVACSAGGFLGELVRVSTRLAVHAVLRRRIHITARAAVVAGAPTFAITRPARVARHMMGLGIKLSCRAQPAGGGCGVGIGGAHGAVLALHVPRGCVDGAVSARWALVA